MSGWEGPLTRRRAVGLLAAGVGGAMSGASGVAGCARSARGPAAIAAVTPLPPDDTPASADLSEHGRAQVDAHVVRWGEGPGQVGTFWRRRSLASGAPVVVLLHGGGWQRQYDRHGLDGLGPSLAGSIDVAVWAPEYRRVGEEGYTAAGMLADVSAAVDHVAALPHVDAARTLAVGHSAGGHLAVWAALSSAGRPARVRPVGAIALAGIFDLQSGLGPLLPPYVASAFPTPADVARADPMLFLPAAVPIAVIHGDADTVVPVDQAVRFARATARAGRPALLDIVAGGTHNGALEGGSAVDLLHRQRIHDLLSV